MASGNKFVIVAYPEDKPEQMKAYSTFAVFCKCFNFNLFAFYRWKRDWDDDNIHVKDMVIRKLEVIR